MSKVISFKELREVKDQLPHGAIAEIAKQLNLNEETVRNYFGGTDFKNGASIGIHVEQGPDGGFVTLDDPTIFNLAKEMIAKKEKGCCCCS
ncbi:MAG: DNA-binding protein [Bacteroides sp.]|jgi:DNA-binding protein